MNRKGLYLLAAILLLSVSAFAQSRKGLVINEVMVQNDSSLMDEYGKYTGWIELYNSTHGTMDISSVYITTDRNNAENARYAIPKNDVNTKIQPLQYAVFHTDGEPGKGTFHTSIQLVPGKENFIALFDANGETLIDSIVVPATLGSNQSYVRMPNGEWEIHNGTNNSADYVTPGSPNTVVEKNNKIDNFAVNDPHGVGMAVMAMSVVFSALLLLYILFRLIGKINARAAHRNKLESQGVEASQVAVEVTSAGADSGEEIAAICMALYEHLNAHDE
ncbi:MAG: OadG family protein, partial [Muribaculaceae bacterium]|nr:OadG family protein [Muribaculaceae bacterium]